MNPVDECAPVETDSLQAESLNDSFEEESAVVNDMFPPSDASSSCRGVKRPSENGDRRRKTMRISHDSAKQYLNLQEETNNQIQYVGRVMNQYYNNHVMEKELELKEQQQQLRKKELEEQELQLRKKKTEKELELQQQELQLRKYKTEKEVELQQQKLQMTERELKEHELQLKQDKLHTTKEMNNIAQTIAAGIQRLAGM